MASVPHNRNSTVNLERQSMSIREAARTTRTLGRLLRRLVLLATVAVLGILGIGATAAVAAPMWTLDLHHNQTNFPPGGTAEYWVELSNVGDAPSSGPISLTVDLPPGVTFNSSTLQAGSVDSYTWSCPGAPGDSVVTCTTTDSIPAALIGASRPLSRALILIVDVAPGACAPQADCDLTTTATVSGGGAPDAPPAASCLPGVAACALELTHVSADDPPFGIVKNSFVGDFFARDGVTPLRQSGGHPYEATFAFDLNTVSAGLNASGDPLKASVANPRHIAIDLPPGFVGYPTAVGECTISELTYQVCPASSQVGDINVTVFPLSEGRFFAGDSGVYNMTPPDGVITDLGMSIQGVPVHIRISLDPANGYSVRSTVSDINETLPPFNSKVRIWGVPADPVHDAQRGPTDQPEKPFLTMPVRCDVDNVMKLAHYDSWANPGAFGPDVLYDMPGRMTGCDAPRFEPAVQAHPTSQRADSPTGLDVKITVPQNDNPNGVSSSPVKSVRVALPAGMSVNPSTADGVGACSPAQIGLGTDSPVACPDTSKIGTAQLVTPALTDPVQGTVYLAKQTDNPFGSLLAMYLVVENDERGLTIKLPGKIEADPTTGQLTTTFDDNPQLPFSSLELHLNSGSRAPLVNPPTCGSYDIDSELRPWTRPDQPVDLSGQFSVTSGPDGGACPDLTDPARFTPSFSAGTVTPIAGSTSPFVLKVSKPDGQQSLKKIDVTLPLGLTAKLAGVPRCAQSAIVSGVGGSTSCPAGSQVGTVTVGAGAGATPFFLADQPVYLTDGYDGAPFGLAIDTHAVAGPFDLGHVVVRTKLSIDPITTQVSADAEPLPSIIQGIPLHIRSVTLKMDRSSFVLNPTSCAAQTIAGQITGGGANFADPGDDTVKGVSSPFQVGGCSDLGLSPKLAISLTGKGQTTDDKHPGVHATVSQTAGQANLKKVVVSLPLSLALDPDNANGLCEFTDGSKIDPTCPKASIVGKAVAHTPILDQPLTGPVYFVKNIRKDPKSGREIRTLPKLVIPLTGENGLRINLVGTSNVVDNRLVTTFDNVPDAPVSDFTLDINGGKGGILVVSGTDICKATQVADQQIDGQNGKTADADVYLQTPACALKILSKKVGKTSVAIKIGGLGAGKVTVTGHGIKKTTKTITKSTVATITAKRSKGKPGRVTVSFDPTGPAKAHKTTK